MIKYVKHNGQIRPAIIMDELLFTEDIREFREALVWVLEECLSNERSKETTNYTSLWFLVRLIDETTIEEKGGVCNG